MKPPRDVASRRFDLANNMLPFLDSQKKPYIHLVDGGVADNLGLRAALERVTLMGDSMEDPQVCRHGKRAQDRLRGGQCRNRNQRQDGTGFEKVPPFVAMLDSYSSIAIERYNLETVALLSESFPRWAEEIRRGRCGAGPVSMEPGSCGDIEFYLVEVRFDSLDDEAERDFLKRLPTSFALKPEEVDRLRKAARHSLTTSKNSDSSTRSQ